ncbi:hypothetical protein [uncultured Psychroserpens sp.]|uniref:hypothetical protein n=1 Tax=uncultured Psychroserpens sp. TaxID=255436 RepID=UPI00262F870E|nr:hypothetical protein [uncultured Psychroserpens sp.]
MKKQTFKLFAILALMLTMGCSVDELQTDQEESIIQEELRRKSESEEGKTKGGNSDQNRSEDPIPLNNPDLIVLNEVPFGVQTYAIYLNMAMLEASYQGSFTGPFNIHYRNEMMTHFTIYSVEFAKNSECAGIERWIINVEEYNAYMISIGNEDGTISGDGTTGNSDGGNTSNATGPGITDIKGGTKPPPPPPDPDDTVIDPDDPDITVNYEYCFDPVID